MSHIHAGLLFPDEWIASIKPPGLMKPQGLKEVSLHLFQPPRARWKAICHNKGNRPRREGVLNPPGPEWGVRLDPQFTAACFALDSILEIKEKRVQREQNLARTRHRHVCLKLSIRANALTHSGKCTEDEDEGAQGQGGP